MSNILVIAPHADDETISMGGTIARLSALGNNVTIAIVTGPGLDAHPIFRKNIFDTVRSEALRAHSLLGAKTVFLNLPTVLLPEVPTYKINHEILQLINNYQPDVMYIPYHIRYA